MVLLEALPVMDAVTPCMRELVGLEVNEGVGSGEVVGEKERELVSVPVAEVVLDGV